MSALDRWELGPGGCWLWAGPVNGSGYGTVTVGDRRLMAHRAMWEAERGDIPAGCALDHKCRSRRCINPAHLEPVTQSENERRKPLPSRVARGDVCPAGHPLVGANKVAGGECRTCNSTRRSGP